MRTKEQSRARDRTVVAAAAEPPLFATRRGLLPHLQRTAGNQAALRFLARRAEVGADHTADSHSKPSSGPEPLTVNRPGDAHERDADTLADRVMRAPAADAAPGLSGVVENRLQRKCTRCEEEEKKQEKLQRTDSGLGPEIAPPIVHDVLRSSGQPLDWATRAFMEQRFEHDFSGVRVHTDTRAAESARAVRSRAYTVGRSVVFGPGEYRPAGTEGKRLLAHELAHVVQQSSAAASLHGSAPRVQRQLEPAEKPLESDDWLIACLLLAPPWLKPFCLDESKPKPKPQPRVPSPAPAPQVSPPSGLPPVPPPVAAPRKLNFYHGTRWSIAQTIPNNVKPIGGGDFAAGFYTHHDVDDSKALGRAVKWGRAMANKPPTEPYAGVVRFGVPETDYRQLFAGGKGKTFDLTKLDQKDFQQKQKEWLDFITSTGRVKVPVFQEKRKQWVHERREPQPSLIYNIIEGPFYKPLKGTKEKKPAPEEFKPYAEGQQLPHQVTWANDGIKLLNSGKVEKELKQYDAKTGKPQDPPVTSTAGAAQMSDKEIIEATEEAQLQMD